MKVLNNLDFFKEVNTEEKAYWLGFIYADGHIFSRSVSTGYLQVVLSDRDKEHLKGLCMVFNADLKTDCNFDNYHGKTWNKCRLSISNANLYNDLSYNFDDIYNLLNNISSGLVTDFIRGYFDGDGSVFINKYRTSKTHGEYRNRLNFSFTSLDYNFLKYIREIICYYSGVRSGCISNTGNNRMCYRLVWCGNAGANKFYNYLYQDAEIYLPRKKHKFEDVLFEVTL